MSEHQVLDAGEALRAERGHGRLTNPHDSLDSDVSVHPQKLASL